MIWLVKSREMSFSKNKNDPKKYLLKCMEPADKYISHIKPGKQANSIKQNINYHLYQLMEIYVGCKVVELYLKLDTKQEKKNLFNHFNDEEFMKSFCSFYDSYCSQFEYNSFSETMKKVIYEMYTENIHDFSKGFHDCVENFSIQTYKDDLTEIDAINGMISFYIRQGIWTAIRIIPTSLCKFEQIIFNANEQPNFDYIANSILSFDNKFFLEPIANNMVFYQEAAKESILSFLELAKKLYDSDIEIQLDKLQNDVILLQKSDIEKNKAINSIQATLLSLQNSSKQNKKFLYYQSLSIDELVKCFYSFYQVPKDFLTILQTIPFEEKIILSKNYEITNGFQTLIITYLDNYVINRKDLDLLRVLFHITSKSIQKSKENYKERLNSFKNYINSHTKS